MSRVMELDRPADEVLRELLRGLLESGEVGSVFALRGSGEIDPPHYALMTEPDLIDQVLPFHPLMPSQGARSLSRLTRMEPSGEKVAALLRPCELRAFTELTKLNQGSLDNFLFISCSCPGVLPFRTALQDGLEAVLEAYRDVAADDGTPSGVRDACSICVEPAPYGADMTIVLAGFDARKSSRLLLNTPEGERAAELLNVDTREEADPLPSLEALKKKRSANRAEAFERLEESYSGIEGLLRLYGKCIDCRGCRQVCPICFCELCDFQTSRNEVSAMGFDIDLKNRGALRTPPQTLDFQLGRISHISLSCVGCGQCSDVCPASIPVATVFAKVSEATQGIFEYLSGRDLEEEVPTTTFDLDELEGDVV